MEAHIQSLLNTPTTTLKSLKSLKSLIDDAIILKKSSLPPNELVTKEYPPEIKPFMKLITKEDLQKSQKNISYVPPKIKNLQYEQYGQLFHVTDFLGYHYADQKKFDEMIYFKFNNKDWHKISTLGNTKQHRFLSGLFIPPSVLASKHFKINQNIYKGLNLDYTEHNDQISQSFGKNYKGCSLDPMFSSNFDSGNLMAVIRKQPYQYDLILQNDINSKGVQWFNFAVKFLQEGTYTFNIVNLTNQSTLYSLGMKIPYYSFHQQSYRTDASDTTKSGSGWSFGCKNVTFSKTDLRKQSQTLTNTYYSLKFMFKCKTRNQICVFANSFPYVSIDFQRFLNRVLYSRIGQHMKMQKIDICDSVGGGKISAYMFYHRKGKSNTLVLKSLTNPNQMTSPQRSHEKHKSINLNSSSLSNSIYNAQSTSQAPQKSIVFLARQHSGQTSSSFVLQGILQFLMDNTQYDTFKKNFNFVIIPFVNVDGVKYGNQRVNLAGSDLNNIWRNPNKTFQPQIYNIKTFLKNLNQNNPISLLINLQSNRNSISTYFEGNLPKKQGESSKIFPYICSKRIKQISYQRSQFYSLQNKANNSNNNNSRAIMAEMFPKALVYNFTTSIYGWKPDSMYKKYSESQDENIIYQFTPDIYRNLGKELISTYLQYIRLCQKNIGIRDRWLKEIDSLPLQLSTQNALILSEETQILSKYQQSWSHNAIQMNFDQFLPQLNTQTLKKVYQPRKNKTFVYKQNRSSQLRSKSKKRSMPGLQNLTTQNAGYLPNQIQSIAGYNNKLQLQQNLKIYKKSNFSSSIFTPKRRSQILKDISQSIKEQKPIQIQEKRQNQKRVSKYLDKYRQSKLKIKDAMVKFQGMKKFMTTMGIKLDGAAQNA